MPIWFEPNVFLDVAQVKVSNVTIIYHIINNHQMLYNFSFQETLAWYLLFYRKISSLEFAKKACVDRIKKQINPDFRQSWFSAVQIYQVAGQTSKLFSECELYWIENFIIRNHVSKLPIENFQLNHGAMRDSSWTTIKMIDNVFSIIWLIHF